MGTVGPDATISVVPLEEVAAIPLPNGSWSRMVLTEKTAPGILSSLGYSVFTPGTTTALVKHEAEEIAYFLAGIGVLETEGEPVPFAAHQALHIPAGIWHAVANTGDEDLIMVFGFPNADYTPTERR